MKLVEEENISTDTPVVEEAKKDTENPLLEGKTLVEHSAVGKKIIYVPTVKQEKITPRLL